MGKINKHIKISIGILLSVVLNLLVFIHIAHAQAIGGAFDGMGDTDEPIHIEADKLEVQDDDNTALLTGNVSVVQGTTIFKASKIKVYYLKGDNAKGSKSGLKLIEAFGKVAVRSKDSQATADEAIIDMVAETVVLSGNVIMNQGKNAAFGCVVRVNLRTKASSIEACKNNSGKKTNRPSITFDPKSKQE